MWAIPIPIETPSGGGKSRKRGGHMGAT